MKGSEKNLVKLYDGSGVRMIIPVYQRNYDWKRSNCRKLYDDLVSMIKDGRENHFFGSIVEMNTQEGPGEISIIDGQQRITTVYLLMLAFVKLLEEGKITSKNPQLAERIKFSYLEDQWEPDDKKLRLKPVKNDEQALKQLFKDRDDYLLNSNLTNNYFYFYDRIQKNELSPDELFSAIQRLMIIDISLKQGEDDAQLIFESLNSTGLDLTEADKVRNYVLMNQTPDIQEAFYEKYWNKIEKNTNYEVTEFLRNYLTFKLKRVPVISNIYFDFKEYCKKQDNNIEEILQDLEKYSSYLEEILQAKTGILSVDAILTRLHILKTATIRPFLLQLFNHWHDQEIDEHTLSQAIKIVETYLVRRMLCSLPTNSLNKIFATLFNDTIRFVKKDGADFLSALTYVLLNKSDYARFPDDGEFINSIDEKDIYAMKSSAKEYLFNRLENQDSLEHVNVVDNMQNGTYTIEHIMPRTLSDAWKKELGPNYQTIYDRWINKLANLTLTAYNSQYSNRTFEEKKTIENGFNDSGFRLNDFVRKCETWGEDELEKRNQYLKDLAMKLWPRPVTSFKPKQVENSIFRLDDEYNFAGHKIISYTFRGTPYQVKTWIDMYLNMIKELYEIDPTPLYKVIASRATKGWKSYLGDTQKPGFTQVEDNLYAYGSCDTWNKLNVLKKLFELYEIDPSELVFEIN